MTRDVEAELELVGEETAPLGMEQTVLPPPGLIGLQPDARDLYQHRLADALVMSSELYQVNSRLRQAQRDLIPKPSDEQALRQWFLESGRSFPEASAAGGAADGSGQRGSVERGGSPLWPFATVGEPLGTLLRQAADDGLDGGLLYAVDLHLVTRDWIWLVPPGQDALVAERVMGPRRWERLAGAVVDDHRDALFDAGAVLALTTVPWRLQVLHGERGYRRALLETGITFSRVASLAAAAGLRPTPLADFADVTVDDCLYNDGVERFCAALIPLVLPAPNGAARGPTS